MPRLNWMDWFLLVNIVASILLEAIAIFNRTEGDTISEAIRSWNRGSGGILALTMAAIWWHWFGWMPSAWR